MENRLKFLEIIEEAAETYACNAEDRDFEVIVKITCEDGWCNAYIVG
ncbi:hypothetical protein HDR58_03635 [bacterium]|nr:hypothetical protein [bacterium]